MKAAEFHARGCSVSPEDLLQTVLEKVLCGERSFRSKCESSSPWTTRCVRESRNRIQRRLHRSGLTLNEVEQRVFWGLEDALRDGLSLGRFLRRWQENPVSEQAVAAWVDEPLQKEWGLHAAARVYSICCSGHDTGFEVGASGRPTLLAFAAAPGARVPGSPVVAGTAYDVAQAMSWVASRNQNTDERAPPGSDPRAARPPPGRVVRLGAWRIRLKNSSRPPDHRGRLRHGNGRQARQRLRLPRPWRRGGDVRAADGSDGIAGIRRELGRHRRAALHLPEGPLMSRISSARPRGPADRSRGE